MTATVITITERATPHCRRCGSALRLANSLRAGFCCCHRGTCGDFEARGCIVCSREIEGIDVVVGVCSACSIVLPQSPAVAVAPRSAAAGTSLGTGRPSSTSPQEVGHAGTPAASRVPGTRRQDKGA